MDQLLFVFYQNIFIKYIVSLRKLPSFSMNFTVECIINDASTTKYCLSNRKVTKHGCWPWYLLRSFAPSFNLGCEPPAGEGLPAQ